MNGSHGVGVGKCVGDLRDQPDGVPSAESARSEQVVQRGAGDEIADEDAQPVSFGDVVDGDDPRMSEKLAAAPRLP